MRASGLVLLAACGRIGFTAAPSASDARGDSATADGIATDGLPAAPTTTNTSSGIVAPAGLTNIGNQSDGTHVVFVDNTPGARGDLVIVRVGDDTATLDTYVSADAGGSWQHIAISVPNAAEINDLGGCQDTVTHAFHISWLDASNADQYARLTPTHVGGDITGFAVSAHFGFFDEGADSPGPRDLAEIVDGAGDHRLVFTGTGRSTGSVGLLKLAVTSVGAGVAPASANDWEPADGSAAGGDDALLPNNLTTGDAPSSFMASTSSNVATGGPVVIVAGFPVDQKLLAWTVTPDGTAFDVGPPQTLSTAFGAGTGARADASLSVASAPSGDVWIAYSESSTGLHVARVDPAGAIQIDGAPQPTTSTAARHAVIATDAASRPAVLYADGAGAIVGTLLWNGAWLPTEHVDTQTAPDAAWSISTAWGSGETFGYYRDAGSAQPTTFSTIQWQ